MKRMILSIWKVLRAISRGLRLTTESLLAFLDEAEGMLHGGLVVPAKKKSVDLEPQPLASFHY